MSQVGAVERVLVLLVVAGWFVIPLLYLFTPWLLFADYRLPAFMPWAGTGFVVVSLWLFWRAHADLGRNWSVTLELRKGHESVRWGVYRYIRHPMYAPCGCSGWHRGSCCKTGWQAGWPSSPSASSTSFGRRERKP